mmetsp:Transcript_90803/g.228363  ORF Transcript_90803/g.228363 Transcript_90803/m.228363 type:complete len:251 (-) Transcript_90803:57-809(-)
MEHRARRGAAEDAANVGGGRDERHREQGAEAEGEDQGVGADAVGLLGVALRQGGAQEREAGRVDEGGDVGDAVEARGRGAHGGELHRGDAADEGLVDGRHGLVRGHEGAGGHDEAEDLDLERLWSLHLAGLAGGAVALLVALLCFLCRHADGLPLLGRPALPHPQVAALLCQPEVHELPLLRKPVEPRRQQQGAPEDWAPLVAEPGHREQREGEPDAARGRDPGRRDKERPECGCLYLHEVPRGHDERQR